MDLFARLGALRDHPRPGDLAFYGNTHVALVVAVPAVGYTVVEAHDLRIAARPGEVVEARTGRKARFGGVGGAQ